MANNIITTNKNSKALLSKKEIDASVQNFQYKPYFADGHDSSLNSVAIGSVQ